MWGKLLGNEPTRPPLAQRVHCDNAMMHIDDGSHYIEGAVLKYHSSMEGLESQVRHVMSEVDPNITLLNFESMQDRISSESSARGIAVQHRTRLLFPSRFMPDRCNAGRPFLQIFRIAATMDTSDDDCLPLHSIEQGVIEAFQIHSAIFALDFAKGEWVAPDLLHGLIDAHKEFTAKPRTCRFEPQRRSSDIRFSGWRNNDFHYGADCLRSRRISALTSGQGLAAFFSRLKIASRSSRMAAVSASTASSGLAGVVFMSLW
jgi:hypothetical protein